MVGENERRKCKLDVLSSGIQKRVKPVDRIVRLLQGNRIYKATRGSYDGYKSGVFLICLLTMHWISQGSHFQGD